MSIREHCSVLYLGMATEILFTIVMYHPDNGQTSYKPQTKHAERMILPGSSQKYLRMYLIYTGAEKQTAKRFGFRHLLSFFLVLSHIKLLTSIAYKLQQ